MKLKREVTGSHPSSWRKWVRAGSAAIAAARAALPARTHLRHDGGWEPVTSRFSVVGKDSSCAVARAELAR